ncbi:hypothetical protein [Methylibium petroleiphilum]|uniref:hypothetical protein n=1 Tax=Methylibium petroleiphilum TaxID=105560 RepID=UPI003D27CE52
MKVRVVGMKFFVGEVNGNKINSGKLYTECKLDDSRNEGERQFAKGLFTEEWKVPSQAVKRLAHLPLPFDADLEVDRVGNGKESRELVIDVRPLNQAAPDRPQPVKAAA